MSALFPTRFKGKLSDLRRALASGELELNEDQEVDFFIAPPKAKNNYCKSKPISGGGANESEIINKLKMAKEEPPVKPRNNLTAEELNRMPRGDNTFVDQMLVGLRAAGKDVGTWAKFEKEINTELGQAIQMLTLLSMMLSVDQSKAEQAMAVSKGDTTNSKSMGKNSPGTLSPGNEIEKEAPLWFKRKIQSILKDNMQKRPAGGRLSGELSHKRLYKIRSTSKVFQKKEMITKKQYNVVLLIDCSGSMSGVNAQMAATCAALISRDFQHLVRLKIKTFNQRNKTIKDFNEKFTPLHLSEPMDRIIKECNSGNGGSNHDWFGLQEANQDLMRERGEKLLIIISDAQPSDCGCGCEDKAKELPEFHGIAPNNAYGLLKAKFQQIHTRGAVRLMSITVGGGPAADMPRIEDLYQKNFTNIGDYGMIYKALTELLSSAIKRK